jgi:hypothetical protein
MDDGIGMPEDVLTGAFLDFGNSLWRSDRITSLYPGLASNEEFRPTGQFGVGFFASFIIGRDVKVLTKPFNGGDDTRNVLHFTNGVRGRAELRAYNEALDGKWPYGQNTIVEIRFAGDKWLSSFAGLSVHQDIGYPVVSSEPEYWDYFANTLERLVFRLNVRVEFTSPFCSEKRVNRTDIFETSRSEFAQEFNRVFAASTINRIPEELTPLIEFVSDGIKSRTRGTVTIDHFIQGIYHIGGLTVFDSEGRGLYGSRDVTGAHQAMPTTAARQWPKRYVSSEKFREWAFSQLRGLDNLDLNVSQRVEALLSIHSITRDLYDKYFLLDLTGNIIYFRDMEICPNDKLFLVCFRHPFSNIIETANYQGIALFAPMYFLRKAEEFRYVLQLHGGTHQLYTMVEFYGKDFSSDPSSAIGQLFSEIRRRGLEPSRSALANQTIGTYAGPDGGHPERFIPNLRKGMLIESVGITVTVSQSI